MTPATMQNIGRGVTSNAYSESGADRQTFHSFDRSTDRRIDEAWSGEIESRIDAYENGNISADSAEAVLERVNQR